LLRVQVDEEELMVREKAKQRTEIKEQRKEEAARQWNTDKVLTRFFFFFV
jgi:hypothetical protein